MATAGENLALTAANLRAMQIPAPQTSVGLVSCFPRAFVEWALKLMIKGYTGIRIDSRLLQGIEMYGGSERERIGAVRHPLGDNFRPMDSARGRGSASSPLC